MTMFAPVLMTLTVFILMEISKSYFLERLTSLADLGFGLYVSIAVSLLSLVVVGAILFANRKKDSSWSCLAGTGIFMLLSVISFGTYFGIHNAKCQIHNEAVAYLKNEKDYLLRLTQQQLYSAGIHERSERPFIMKDTPRSYESEVEVDSINNVSIATIKVFLVGENELLASEKFAISPAAEK